MRACLYVVLAVALGGCLFRPWDIEESSRIDAIVQSREDPADGAAADGIPAPKGLSPTGLVADARGALASAEPSLGKRKKKGGNGSKADPFKWAGPEAPKAPQGSKGIKKPKF